jgi:hypothetical protein
LKGPSWSDRDHGHTMPQTYCHIFPINSSTYFPAGWASLRRGAGTWAELLLSTMTVLPSTTTHMSQSPRTHAYQNQNTTIHVYTRAPRRVWPRRRSFLRGGPSAHAFTAALTSRGGERSRSTAADPLSAGRVMAVPDDHARRPIIHECSTRKGESS